MTSLKTALEEILGRHKVSGTCGACRGQVRPCDAARLAKAMMPLVDAAKALRIDANRLCDRNLGGTYEDDCRRAILAIDEALAQAAQELGAK